MGVESHALGRERYEGNVIDQAWFCGQVAATNKLEFLKWAREVKQCEWDEWTINAAALKVISRCSSTASLMVARVIKKSRAFKLLVRTPRLSSIAFRQSETFARYGKRSSNTSNMRWSRGDLEIFR